MAWGFNPRRSRLCRNFALMDFYSYNRGFISALLYYVSTEHKPQYKQFNGELIFQAFHYEEVILRAFLTYTKQEV